MVSYTGQCQRNPLKAVTSGRAAEEDDRQQADRRKREVGEGVASEIRKEASHGCPDSVTGSPGEVRDREGYCPFHTGLFSAT